MSLLSQLLNLREETLTEATLQSIVKKNSVPIGSFEKVFGEDAHLAAEMLRAEVTDAVYELKGTDQQAVAAKKSLLGKAIDGTCESVHDMIIVKLTGKRYVLVLKDRVLTSKEHFDSLVEAQGDAESHPLKGKVSNAFNNFLSPFKSSSSWVEDGRGSNVCEATDAKTAKEIAKLLNEAYPHSKVKT